MHKYKKRENCIIILNTTNRLEESNFHAFILIIITHELINPSAVLPDLSLWSSEWTNVSHLNHGCNKIRAEGARVFTVSPYNGVGGSPIEQLLIRVEQPPLADEVVEVLVVKICWSLDVKRWQIVVPWPTRSWAVALLGFSKGKIDVALVVYASPERCAPCLSNCVCSWTIYSMILQILIQNTEYKHLYLERGRTR